MSDRERSRSRSRSRSPERPKNEGVSEPNASNDQEVKLYIGNLDYGTTDDRLRAHFEAYGTITDAFIPMEKGTDRPRGFGFVTFSTREEADKAMQSLDGSELDGRQIRISESKPREKSNGPFNASGQSDVKLFVGNLSFETKVEKIRELFETIGEVKDCYMPSERGGGRPRGFAFVTMPANAAETAMKKLTGEDLDGRSIRIEEAGGKKSSGGGPRDDYRGDRYMGDRYGDRHGDRYGGGYGGRKDYRDRDDRGGDRRGRDNDDRGRGRDHDYDDRGRGRDYDYDRRRNSRDRDDRGYGDRRRDYDDRDRDRRYDDSRY